MVYDRLRIENLVYWFSQPEVKTERRRIMDEDTKECFGEQCKGCKDFYGCTEHFPYGCWGEE